MRVSSDGSVLTISGDIEPATLTAVTLDSLADLLAPQERTAITLRAALADSGIDTSEPGALQRQWTWSEHDLVLSFPIGEARSRNLSSHDVGIVETLTLGDPSIAGNSGPVRGMHGAIQGMTGSGKTHMIDAWMSSLAARYSPDRVMFLLARRPSSAIDPALPHIAGTFTQHDATNPVPLHRFLTQIRGEVVRREKFLADSGANSHGEYLQMRATAPAGSRGDLPALPSLIIFWELCDLDHVWKPELEEVCTQGRALGVHVIIVGDAVTPLSAGELVWQQMSFFVSLAVPNARTSIQMLGVPDAAHIKAPNAFIRYARTATHTDDLVPFAAFPDRTLPAQAQDALLTATGPLHIDATPLRPTTLAEAAPTIPEITEIGDPTFRLGDIDDAFHHARLPLSVTMNSAYSHLLVVGNAGSGKTSTLATLIGSAGVSHDPALASFYVLDPTGAGLSGVADRHNVGGYASATDIDLMGRLIGEATRLISHRETAMATARTTTFADYFTNRGGPVADDPYGHYYLVIDRIDTLIDRYPEFHQPILQILSTGAAVGVHVIATASKVGYTLQSHFGTLYLACNVDELMITEREQRLAIKEIDASYPGRTVALNAPWQPAQIFTSATSESSAAQPVHTSTASKVTAVGDNLTAGDLPFTTSDRIVIGRNRYTGQAVTLPWPTNLVVAGAGRSGRSNVLRMTLSRITECQTPQQASIFISDPNRSLRHDARSLRDAGFLDPTCGYAYDRDSLRTSIDAIVERLRRTSTTPQEVLDGPDRVTTRADQHLFVLVDDYAQLTDGFAMQSEFDRLAEYLGQHDIGLSVIVTMTDTEWTAFKESFSSLPKAMAATQAPLLALSGNTANSVRPTMGDEPSVKFTNRRPGEGMLMRPSAIAELVTIQTPHVPPRSPQS